MLERSGALDEVEIGVRFSNGKFTRNIFIDKDEISYYRSKYKNRGVYVSAYCYEDAKGKTDESLLFGHLYIDLDNPELKDESIEEEAFEKIRADGLKVIGFLSALMGVDEEMVKIYYSGQKGIHIVAPATIFGIKPMKELNYIFKVIAKDMHKMSKHKTVDTQIYDNARLLSLPGSKHPVTGRYKIPLTLNELRTLTFPQIKKLSMKKRKVDYKRPVFSAKAHRMLKSYQQEWENEKRLQSQKSKKKGAATLSFMPPCIESILKRPCPEGYRNHTASALTSYYKSRGLSKEKAWQELSNWNSEYANLPSAELNTTFESIFNGEYTYGCATLETIGDCCKDKCKIGQQRIKKEKEALAQGAKSNKR